MNKIKDILDTIYYERKKILIFIIILLSIGSYFIVNNNKNKNSIIEEDEPIIENTKKEEKKEELINNKIVVDIKGEVNNPGCYEVDSELRVKDIITLAGGLKEDASTDDINLSSKIFDEMVIVINKKEEVVVPIQTTKDIIVNNSTNISDSVKTTGKVSINNGTVEELCTLNGIKEARANKIIEYRNTNGPFKNIEEIKNVSGIGESIFAKIKDHITL